MTQLGQQKQTRSQPGFTDVIVLGAGVSGLQTAYKLQQSGSSCLVLEESGRVGSQSFTNDNFNVESHPRTHALATEFGLIDETSRAQGKTTLEGFDSFDHDEQPAVSDCERKKKTGLRGLCTSTNELLFLAYSRGYGLAISSAGYS